MAPPRARMVGQSVALNPMLAKALRRAPASAQ
jgi:hypothetical protein